MPLPCSVYVGPEGTNLVVWLSKYQLYARQAHHRPLETSQNFHSQPWVLKKMDSYYGLCIDIVEYSSFFTAALCF